jgi:hypothetical protein
MQTFCIMVSIITVVSTLRELVSTLNELVSFHTLLVLVILPLRVGYMMKRPWQA